MNVLKIIAKDLYSIRKEILAFIIAFGVFIFSTEIVWIWSILVGLGVLFLFAIIVFGIWEYIRSIRKRINKRR